jgi:translation initiation factor 2A
VSGGKSKSQIKREKLKKKKEEEMQQEQSAEASTPPAVADPSGEAIDPEKRARKLKKILKQIEELKLRDCCDLNEDQKAKIASEAQIRAELTDLKG